MERTVEELQSELAVLSGVNVDIKINYNRYTMLRILACGERWTRVSMNHIFLNAPKEVVHALAVYMAKYKIDPTIKGFINERTKKLDYSYKVRSDDLVTEGKAYCLQQILDELKSEYFDDDLPLCITWYGDTKKLPRTRIVLGQYHHLLKLIKIHRILDQVEVPRYFVKFVIYHEILHHFYPPIVNKKGQRDIHTKEFRAQEAAYPDYMKAILWEKQHPQILFPHILKRKKVTKCT
ncbi:MAG: hypothetical protein K0S74_1670 [Chlamydiales bacterium]|jgi:hypothetical protein|nr:hypothetical protein [Chlamydiales bacterium]